MFFFNIRDELLSLSPIRPPEPGGILQLKTRFPHTDTEKGQTT